MATNDRISLCVGIPAYNEEKNIQALLESILSQREDFFILKKIFVISDGSTDRTCDISENIEDSRILTVRSTQRLGKSARLNQIFELCDSDICVLLDADISILSSSCLDSLASCFRSEPCPDIVSGSSAPFAPHTFIQRLLFAGTRIWDLARENASAMYYCEGTIRAFKKNVYKKMKFPIQSADDVYPYLYSVKHGLRFLRSEKALVNYELPSTLRDYLKQSKRFLRSRSIHEHNFDEKTIESSFSIRLGDKLGALFTYLIKHPLLTIGYSALVMAGRIAYHLSDKKDIPAWQIAGSTKKLNARKKPKIVFSTYDDIRNPYYGGGGARAIHELSLELTRYYDVEVITGNFPKAISGDINGVKYSRIGPAWLGPRIGQLYFITFLPYYARKISHDIWIESFTPPFSASLLPLLNNKPVIGLTHMLAARDMEVKYGLPFRYLENAGLKLYRDIIALTPDSAKKIEKSGSKARIEVIPNGIKMPSGNIPEADLRKGVMFIGRIDIEQKGIDILLSAFARIKDRIDDALIIAGSGKKQEEDKLKAMINEFGLEDKTCLCGRVENERKEELFRNCAVCILPSRRETFPLIALEALSNGLPLIASDIDALRWLPENCAVKFARDDILGLADAMITLLKDGGKREKLSYAGRELAQDYGWDKIAQRWAEVIDNKMRLEKK